MLRREIVRAPRQVRGDPAVIIRGRVAAASRSPPSTRSSCAEGLSLTSRTISRSA